MKRCTVSLFPEYLCHVYVRTDNLSAVVIADTEYPQRVCFSLLEKVRFTHVIAKSSSHTWSQTFAKLMKMRILSLCHLNRRADSASPFYTNESLFLVLHPSVFALGVRGILHASGQYKLALW